MSFTNGPQSLGLSPVFRHQGVLVLTGADDSKGLFSWQGTNLNTIPTDFAFPVTFDCELDLSFFKERQGAFKGPVKALQTVEKAELNAIILPESEGLKRGTITLGQTMGEVIRDAHGDPVCVDDHGNPVRIIRNDIECAKILAQGPLSVVLTVTTNSSRAPHRRGSSGGRQTES